MYTAFDLNTWWEVACWNLRGVGRNNIKINGIKYWNGEVSEKLALFSLHTFYDIEFFLERFQTENIMNNNW